MPHSAPSGRYRVRKATSALMTALCGASVVTALIPLGFILFFILRQGIPALDVAFFTQMPRPVGETGGGMANAVVGTAILIGLAALLAVPVGITCGVYISEFKTSRLAPAVRFAADILNGVPSIVIGIFVYTLVVRPMRHFSALAGGIALGVIMIPIVLRTTEELVRMVPASLQEAALALGLPQWKVVLHVVLPTARAGIITGVMVAVARIAGSATVSFSMTFPRLIRGASSPDAG